MTRVFVSIPYWIIVALITFTSTTYAQSITVDNTNDNGIGSLRQAVIDASPGDTIFFSPMLDGDHIALTGPEIILDKNLIIIGRGIANTIIDGQNNSRIFSISDNRTVSIHDLTLQNGNAVDLFVLWGGQGGAILNFGALFMTNCAIRGNSAIDGGAIYNNNNVDAEITLINCTVSGNTASVSGGGVYNLKITLPSGITEDKTSKKSSLVNGVNFINTTITGNTAGNIGGGVVNTLNAEFTNSIVAKNTPDNIWTAPMAISTIAYSLIDVDPLFIMDVPANDSLGGDLRLQCNSPGINAGNNPANTTTTDIIGNPRLVGTLDIGAYERSADTGTKMVTTLADDGPGSLRFIVSSVCPSDTIRFDGSLDGDSIKLTSGEITIDTNLVIVGNGINHTIIDGQGNSRIFHITAGDTVSINDITLQHGNGVGASFVTGGAILNEGQLSIVDAIITENYASTGGGITNSGSAATAILNNTTISGNSALLGGAMYSTTSTTTTITNCKIRGNSSTGLAGGVYNTGAMTFINSIISGNIAVADGGGVYNQGTSDFINTAVSGNQGSKGGGVYNSVTSTFNNSTISGNTATVEGGGCYNLGLSDFTNSIIAKNIAPAGPDIFHFNHSSTDITDGGHNLIGDSTGVGTFFTLTTLQGGAGGVPLDPLFVMDVPANDSLGGDLRPACGSPLIDSGSNTAASGAMVPATDILGKPRIIDGDVDGLDTIDIGAYEFQITDAVALVTNTADSGCGSLRFAVANAIAGDTIRFDESLDGDTIKLTSVEIILDKNLVIIGNNTSHILAHPGSNKTIIDGNGNSRIFQIPSTSDTVAINSVTLQNGNGTGTIENRSGGAIYNNGKLSCFNTIIFGNSANSGGGGLYNDHVASFTKSTISGNFSFPIGGGICVFGTTTFTNSIISENSATGSGGGIYGFGIVTITNSVISGNSAGSGRGGGILINASASPVTLINTVVSGNSASQEGGGLWSPGKNTLINSTITGNSAAIGGGLYLLLDTTTLTNSIIAKNFAPSNNDIKLDNSFDGFGATVSIIDSLNNLIGDSTGVGTFFTLTTLQGGAGGVLLDPLFVMDVPAAPSIGGNLNLACGSIAIDAGRQDTMGLNLGPVDMAGMPRITAKGIDIGAYEKEAVCQKIDVVDVNQLSISDSTTIDFGEVCGISTDSFYVKNIGSQQIIIDSIEIDSIGSNTTMYTYNTAGFTQPDTINCGDSLLLVITFDPQMAGADSALLRIYNNDPDHAIFDLVLTGTGDKTAPTATYVDTIIYLDVHGLGSIDTSYFDLDFSDNCMVSSVALDDGSFDCNDIGPVTAMITITDGYGNATILNPTVTVVDTISPIVSCRDTTIYLDVSGMATIDSSYIMVSAADACGVASVVPSKTDFNCDNVGINMVSLTATDHNGNISNCTATVTVLDTISPVVICMDTTIYLDAAGSATIDTSYILSSLIEGCIDTVYLSKTSFSCLDAGSNIVSLTAKDLSGLTAVCTATVTVLDTISPIVMCKDTSIYLDASGSATIDASFVIEGASDVCGIGSVTLSKTAFTCGGPKTNIVTITTTDNNGNTTICTATVTILSPEVISTADIGIGSLRHAVLAACPGDTITFDESLDGDTIKLTSGEIRLDKNLTIIGRDTSRTIIDGSGNSRIFTVWFGDTIHVDNLTIRNGNPSGFGAAFYNFGTLHLKSLLLANHSGAAIAQTDQDVLTTIHKSTIRNNSAAVDNRRGSIRIDSTNIISNVSGGSLVIFNDDGGLMIINHSNISSNETDSNGSVIWNKNAQITVLHSKINNNISGGIFNDDGLLNIDHSEINGNEGPRQALYNFRSGATASINNSKIKGNETGGLFNLSFATMTIKNSVISGNNRAPGSGGGISNESDAILNIINSTITGNSANNAGGIFNGFNGVINMTNTILAGNTASNILRDIDNRAIINNLGGNLIGDNRSIEAEFPGDGIFVGTAAAPVTPGFEVAIDLNNTPTTAGDLRLACGSPAIDAGLVDTSTLNLGLLDIAGLSRIAGKRIDIGAHEKEATCHEIAIIDMQGSSIEDSAIISKAEVCEATIDTFYIKNVGDHLLVIDSISIGLIGANAGMFNYNSTDFNRPDTINCGDSLQLRITFDPQVSEVDSAMVRIYNNDADESIYHLMVTGSGDHTAPTLICQDTTVYLDASGTVTIDTSYVLASVMDECGIDTVFLSKTSFSCQDIGSNMINLTAKDINGFTSTCSSNVTVLDTISPIVICMDTTIYLNASGDATIDSSFIMTSVTDICGIASVVASTTGFNCNNIGVNTVSLTATDKNGNTATCSATVTVLDTISPIITCMDTTIYLDASGDATIDSSFIMTSATDICGISSVTPSKTDFNCNNIGINRVSLTATDKNGNTATCFATVTVLDTISPIVICMDTTIVLDANGMATLDTSYVLASVTENCEITSVTLSQTTFSCSDVGTQEIIITAIDASGNSNTCTAQVEVSSSPVTGTSITGPTLICPDLSGMSYSIDPVESATSYQWSYTGTGVTINNNGSADITMDFSESATAGTLQVTVLDACLTATVDIEIGSGEFCDFADCVRTAVTVDDELINLAQAIEIFQARDTISSDANIRDGYNITFKAGKEIRLDPGFMVEAGALFEAIIGACE